MLNPLRGLKLNNKFGFSAYTFFFKDIFLIILISLFSFSIFRAAGAKTIGQGSHFKERWTKRAMRCQAREVRDCSVPEKRQLVTPRMRILSSQESNKAAKEIIRCNYSSAVSACLWGLAAIWLNTPHFEKFVIWQ